MKYLLLGFNNGDLEFNRAFQSFQWQPHPDVERIFEQTVDSGWPVATPQSVGITAFPAVAFMALTGRKPDGEACYKVAKVMQGGRWSRERIANAIPSIPPIVDFSCGGGNVPGADGEGNFNPSGLLSLPPWLLLAGTVLAGYKTANARNTFGSVAYGALTAVWGTKYLQAKALHDSAPLALGKTTDTLPIKPGSRVSQHWNKRIKEKDWTGRKKRFTVHTANTRDILDRFNLHSIEFGNWVPQDERQQFLVGLDESLADLAKVFGVRQNQIGLGGNLAISFGARGRGSALATYHPAVVLINLTRTKGIGSLAHEYGHALDYHLSTALSAAPSSRSYRNSRNVSKATTLAGKAMDALTMEYGQPNSFLRGLRDMPKYWRSHVEIWARSFETLVQWELEKKGKYNRMLTKRGYSGKVYPNRKLLKKARAAMMAYSRYALNKSKPRK